MKALTSFGVAVVLTLFVAIAAAPRAAGCDPVGNVRFVCDQVAPEDLAPVPGSQWMIASGMAANGAIRLIDLRDTQGAARQEDVRLVPWPDRSKRKGTVQGARPLSAHGQERASHAVRGPSRQQGVD
jgi:hypothetical protein